MKSPVKEWIKLIAILLTIIFGLFTLKKYINEEIAKSTQKIEEKHLEEVASLKSQCENDIIEREKKLKSEIIELQFELEKTKIFLEKIQKQSKLTETIKKDVKGFISEFDKLIGTKGKKDEK